MAKSYYIKNGHVNRRRIYAKFYDEEVLLCSIREQHANILEFLDFLDEDVPPTDEELSLMFLNRI